MNRHPMPQATALTESNHAMESAPKEQAWLSPKLYPFQTRRFLSADGQMSYIDEGSGRPFLFVHGTPSWSFEWRDAIRSLSPRFRCVACDHLGFGLSDKPPMAPYTPRDHAARLIEFVRKLDLRDVTLVVHDFGGPIGLRLALDEPDRVRDVVCLNTWMWAETDPKVKRLSALIASPIGHFLYKWLNASPRFLVPASFGDRAKLTPEIHRHYLGPFQNRRDRVAPWVLGKELWGSREYYDELWSKREVLKQKPLRVIWGMKDPALTPALLQRFKDEFPLATFHELEGIGHFPQEETNVVPYLDASC